MSMRKLTATAAAVVLAGMGAIVPAGSAQSSEPAPSGIPDTCTDNWRDATRGYVYAYRYTLCDGYLGRTGSWDSNWGNSSGPFRGNDDNAATSVLNKGRYKTVKFFRLSSYRGGHTCLKRSDAYDRDLGGNYFTGSIPVNNRISSHKWVTGGCSRFLD
ncbi:hypothetical protein [Streptomyces sp. MAR4 CNX-425]|uniref:hypothetical protein n=1 Tax=Streptomyces sp. MAR4 CNX-425 TaxID=3406343 RepID=UPI003B50451C